MKDLSRLFRNAGILVILVAVSLVLLFLLPAPYSDNLSAIINKRDLLKDGRRDRIIFVGGSGLFDGLDSRMVSERLHRPVVNMGLYAGFGVTPLLREISPYLRKGDTVVIVPEYSVIFDRPDFQARKWVLALAPARNLPLLYRNIPRPALCLVLDVVDLLRSKFQALPKAIRESIRTRSLSSFDGGGYAYYDRYYNRYGDSLRTMRAAVPGEIEQRGDDIFAVAAYRDQSFAAVGEFCRSAAERGIDTYFAFPAFPDAEYHAQEQAMRRYEARLRSELTCTVLGKPEDFVYPYSYFTNTVNHINNEARGIRTEKLLSYLQQELDASRRR